MKSLRLLNPEDHQKGDEGKGCLLLLRFYESVGQV